MPSSVPSSGLSSLFSPFQSLRSLQSSNNLRTRARPSGKFSTNATAERSANESRVAVVARSKMYERFLNVMAVLNEWHMRANVTMTVYWVHLGWSIACAIASFVVAGQSAMGAYVMCIQVMLSTSYLLHKQSFLPCLKALTNAQNGYLTSTYSGLTAALTLTSGFVFMSNQNQVYSTVIACCNTQFAFTKVATCYGEASTNGTIYFPSSCVDGTTWRTTFNRYAYASYCDAAFCVFQCIVMQWATSEIVAAIQSGHIFCEQEAPRVHPKPKLRPSKTDAGLYDVSEERRPSLLAPVSPFKRSKLELSSTLLQEEQD
ncbi:hypothetical protein BC830DRAFT_870356 [Chytriomyces sp. MP71]|nr:hypothetical protein BC830DRAFT_870356 [Chytriomyces sp. MP71]